MDGWNRQRGGVVIARDRRSEISPLLRSRALLSTLHAPNGTDSKTEHRRGPQVIGPGRVVCKLRAGGVRAEPESKRAGRVVAGRPTSPGEYEPPGLTAIHRPGDYVPFPCWTFICAGSVMLIVMRILCPCHTEISRRNESYREPGSRGEDVSRGKWGRFPPGFR